MGSWKNMSDNPEPRIRRPSRAKTYNPINPAIVPGSPKSDAIFSGPTETYQEKDDRHYFLEDLYGKQDEGLPKDKRVRRAGG